MRFGSALRRRRARARERKALFPVSSRRQEEETVITTFCPASLAPTESESNNVGLPVKADEIELAERGLQVVNSLSRDLTELGLGSVIEELSDPSSDEEADVNVKLCTATVHTSVASTEPPASADQLSTIYEEIEFVSN